MQGQYGSDDPGGYRGVVQVEKKPTKPSLLDRVKGKKKSSSGKGKATPAKK